LKLFDTHFHWDRKTKPEVIVEEAKQNNIQYGVCVGGDYKSSVESFNFAGSFDNYWFSAGVHPHGASKFKEGLACFNELFSSSKMVAVGEIGLDFFYGFSDRKSQLKVMEIFTECALDLNKPLIVHCRDKDEKFDAYKESYQILKDFAEDGGRFVVHCFTGNSYWLDKFLELGAYIGITGIVTFPAAENIRKLVLAIPDERLLIETDSPYLAPKPYRGKMNFPKYLIEIAKKLAEIKSMDIGKLSELTTSNAMKFYRLNI
jgi:TatD DNase family protein